MARTAAKTDTLQDLHHPWCKFVAAPREGCAECDRLHAEYPFRPGETEAQATARYFPVKAAPAPTAPKPAPAGELIMLKRGREIIQATEPMRQAHLPVQEALDELEILLREQTVERRRIRKADEEERIETIRTTMLKATRRRTGRVILETEGHKREARKVITLTSTLEKQGKLPRDLTLQLQEFAKLVANGMGAATEDTHDSSNHMTSPYEPVATLSGYGSRTPADRQLTGMGALQAMNNRVPPELIPIFNQIVDEEVGDHHPFARTLAELGERLGYKHKQTSAAGGALVYAVTCIIAHFMREQVWALKSLG